MKRHSTILLLLILSFVILGCNHSQYPDDDKFDPNWDYPYAYHVQGYGLETTSSERGYYFLIGNFIYYMDKNGTKPVLLDNRPDHSCKNNPNSTNCYAYVEQSERTPPQFLQYYNSQLYVLENYWDHESTTSKFDTVWKMSRLDKDGKNRKEIKVFKNAPKTLAIHRGYLYYSTASADKDGKKLMEVVKVKLEGDMQEEVIFSGADNINEVSSILPYGNQLYWLAWTDKGYITQRYDLTSESISTLWARGDGGLSNLLSIAGNKLYFSYFYTDPMDERTLKIYGSDLKGGNVEEVKLEHPPIISNFYQDHLYSFIRPIPAYFEDLPKGSPNKLMISKDGVKVTEVDLSKISNLNEIVVGDERFMFLKYSGENWKEGIMYLDKAEIESKQAKFKPLIEVNTKPSPKVESR